MDKPSEQFEKSIKASEATAAERLCRAEIAALAESVDELAALVETLRRRLDVLEGKRLPRG